MLDQHRPHERGAGRAERLQPRELEAPRAHRDRRAHREAGHRERQRGERDDPQRGLHADAQRPLDRRRPLRDPAGRRRPARRSRPGPPRRPRRSSGTWSHHSSRSGSVHADCSAARPSRSRSTSSPAPRGMPGRYGTSRSIDTRHGRAVEIELHDVPDLAAEGGQHGVGRHHRHDAGVRERHRGHPRLSEQQPDRVQPRAEVQAVVVDRRSPRSARRPRSSAGALPVHVAPSSGTGVTVSAVAPAGRSTARRLLTVTATAIVVPGPSPVVQRAGVRAGREALGDDRDQAQPVDGRRAAGR